jgi:hypothetical protein
MVRKLTQYIFLLLIAVPAIGGCSIGDAPSGPSQEEYQKKLDSMSTEDRIKWIQTSPLTPDKKAKMIADLKAKTGAK